MTCVRAALEKENARLTAENSEVLAYMTRLVARVMAQCPEVLCVNSEVLGTARGHSTPPSPAPGSRPESNGSSTVYRSEDGRSHRNGSAELPSSKNSEAFGAGPAPGGLLSKWVSGNRETADRKKRGIMEVSEEMV